MQQPLASQRTNRVTQQGALDRRPSRSTPLDSQPRPTNHEVSSLRSINEPSLLQLPHCRFTPVTVARRSMESDDRMAVGTEEQDSSALSLFGSPPLIHRLVN